MANNNKPSVIGSLADLLVDAASMGSNATIAGRDASAALAYKAAGYRIRSKAEVISELSASERKEFDLLTQRIK